MSATRLQRPDQDNVFGIAQELGASTAYHESAVSDNMRTFTEDVHYCLERY